MAHYEEWIKAYVARVKSQLLGRCAEAVQEMAAAFPALRVAKGHVDVPGWGRRGHWWLVDKDGQIVDPTAGQFPAIFGYEEYQDGQEIRVGTCMNCGEGTYAYSMAEAEAIAGCPPSVCSPDCERALHAYYSRPNL